MDRKSFWLTILFALVLAACSGGATPASAPTPTPVAPTPAPVAPTTSASAVQPASTSGAAALETKTNEGGSVTVKVTPMALKADEPAAFEIAMDTHSVDLSDDMTAIVILRDDAGKEYKPSAWEGGEAGGHHREGTLKFAALSDKPKFVELVIKGLAKVPERVFRWDVP